MDSGEEGRHRVLANSGGSNIADTDSLVWEDMTVFTRVSITVYLCPNLRDLALIRAQVPAGPGPEVLTETTDGTASQRSLRDVSPEATCQSERILLCATSA